MGNTTVFSTPFLRVNKDGTDNITLNEVSTDKLIGLTLNEARRYIKKNNVRYNNGKVRVIREIHNSHDRLYLVEDNYCNSRINVVTKDGKIISIGDQP